MASEPVRLEIRDGVAILTIDNPPVNALSAAVTAALLARLAEAERDPAVGAAVLTGANGRFSGGADIREFERRPPPRPTVPEAIAAIESSRLPFVAALEGSALGGGLELALACDARIVRAGTLLGQPEIKLGLIPGAGGTQRLPRIIGVDAAVEMILSGEPIGAARARELGLADLVVDDAPLPAAVGEAQRRAGRPRRRASAAPAAGELARIAAARARLASPARGGAAAHAALDALEDALRLPFDAGLAAERARFLTLRDSDEARARRYLFFAERRAARGTGLPAPSPPPRTAAVIGAGTMGTGIAMTLANAGIAVTLIDVTPELIERARATVARNYDATLARGGLSAQERDARIARIGYAVELDAAARADLVIEAVFEDLEIKRELFRKLDGIVRRDAMLTTNTSTLDIDAIAAATSRPESIVGTHFFSPANVMRLLEIVRGANTTPQALSDAVALAKHLKKVGVVAGNCDGFIGNRMLARYRREAGFLLEEGATPQQVDRVIRDFGFPMGPFAMNDLTGLDVSWRVRQRQLAAGTLRGRYSKLADRLCELGRFGQKTGAGFYRYESGSRTPLPDPFVEELIREVARDAGIVQREIGDDEIRKRCLYPLIDEAAAILSEGIAACPSDIDVVWVTGYGFPAFRGGPLYYADSLGVRTIHDEMLEFERIHGPAWHPSPLLAALAESGTSFAQLGLANAEAS
jgi:3-hydroxyacyl-CoA dehydrogenase